MWIIHYYSCPHFIQTKQTIFPILPSYLPIQTPHCICLHASLSHDHCGAFAVSTVFISASLMCTWFAFTTLILLHICPISLCMLWVGVRAAVPLLCFVSRLNRTSGSARQESLQGGRRPSRQAILHIYALNATLVMN